MSSAAHPDGRDNATSPGHGVRLFDIREHRICFAFPRRTTEVNSWHEHIPFAFLCVSLLRPRIFVELGTFKGDSYCAINQALEDLGVSGTSYAVDGWVGDVHTGSYGDEVYNELKAYHDPLYGMRSRLVRATFDDALAQFADGSIDLLHIDGTHTYEAVRHDFESWYPKLSERGVVMFHDVNVHESDFGVWRLWDELSPRWPSFAFTHGNGLGVLAVGTMVPTHLRDFIAQANDPQQQLQDIFYALGQRVAAVVRLGRADAELAIYRRDIPIARDRILAQDLELDGLRRGLAEEGAKVQAAADQEAELRRHIGYLEQDIGNLRQNVGELSQDISRLNQDNSKLNQDIGMLGQDNSKLNQVIINLEQARQQLAGTLDAVYNSTSWRLTKPVRFGRRLLGSALRASRQGLRQRPAATLAALSHATSWRMTRPVRFGRRLLGRVFHAAPEGLKPFLRALRSTRLEVKGAVSENADDGPDISSMEYQPLVSVIMPVYEIEPLLLTKAVESVQAQDYRNWELCICDDGSTRSDTRAALDRLAAAEPRIKLTRAEVNVGISAASNRALALSSGEFVAFLDHDDTLAPAALRHYVRRLNDRRETDVIYGDEDKIDFEGRRSDAFYKPDWSPVLFCGVMYVGHLLMVRRTVVEEIGRFDSAYDGVQDFELMLRLSERTRRIEHVRKIVYHWRSIPGSLASSVTAKPDITLKQAKAVTAHLRRLGIRATARPHARLPHRVLLTPEARSDWPLVSIIIPSKDKPDLIGRCLDTIFASTTYRNFEVIVVDNGTTDRRALDILASYPVRVVRFDEPFNFSKANNIGAAEAKGDYLLLLNNDTEIIDGDWIEALVSCMELPQVGAVGPLLLYPNRTVQHAGVALGLRGTADHVMRGFPADSDGYAGSLACTREVSAVTAACLMVRRSLYWEIGGMRDNYATHYQDVDFCLRLRRAGYSVLYTPATSIIHHESATRGPDYDKLDRALFKDAWDPLILRGDPYHNPAVAAYA